MKGKLAALVLLLAAAPAQKQYKPKNEVIPGPPVKQPIAYSHKVHVALGLTCTACHRIAGEGFVAGYPAEQFCMGCHATVKKDSPEIARLAAFAASKKPAPWARVYQVPDFVWFSHATHAKDKKVDCTVCHGDVASRDVLFQEKSTSMNACMECHAAHKAPNGCDYCHATQ